MTRLLELDQRVRCWLADETVPGSSNVGVVIDDDGVTVIDALLTPMQARPLFDEVMAIGLPIRRLVLTSSHAPQVGGSGIFALPAVYGTAQVSTHLDQPADVATLAAMFPDAASDLVEIDEVPTRSVTHTVGEAAWLSPSAVVAPVSGELHENLVVQIPELRIVFAGAMASFGATPMAGGGSPDAWADALDTVLEWGEIVVPGTGPIGGAEEVAELQGYLRACVAAEGDPNRVAAGPWDSWTGRHYDAINVERAAMLAAGDDSPPPSLLGLLGLS